MIKTKAQLTGEHLPGIAERALPWSRAIRSIARFGACDIATVALIAALVVIVLCTFKDYAISNDEGVQHHYGELIIAYYRSGFRVRDLFTFENLYLYGGLFDVVAVALSHVIPMDPYQLRHILCAMHGDWRDRRQCGDRAIDCGTARRSDRGGRAHALRCVVRRHVQPHQGYSVRRANDGSDAVPRPLGAPIAVASRHRRCGLRPSGWRGARGAEPWVAAVCLSRSCNAHLSALGRARRSAHALCGELRAQDISSRGIGLSHHDHRLAMGRAVAAQSDPRPVCLLRISLRDPHRLCRTRLQMADVPRIYVPGYLLIRVPLITQAGAALAMISLVWHPLEAAAAPRSRFGVVDDHCSAGKPGAVSRTRLYRHAAFSVRASSARGTGGRRFSELVDALAMHGRRLAAGAIALVCACFVWEGTTLVRLHPYENLSYNALVGGFPGAFRRYDLDYWFNSMPEAIRMLETFVRERGARRNAQGADDLFRRGMRRTVAL